MHPAQRALTVSGEKRQRRTPERLHIRPGKSRGPSPAGAGWQFQSLAGRPPASSQSTRSFRLSDSNKRLRFEIL